MVLFGCPLIFAFRDVAGVGQPLFIRWRAKRPRSTTWAFRAGAATPSLNAGMSCGASRRVVPNRPGCVLRAHYAALLRPRPRRPPRMCGRPPARHSVRETVLVGLVRRWRGGVLERPKDLRACRSVRAGARARAATSSSRVPRAPGQVDEGVRHGHGDRLPELRGGLAAASRERRRARGPSTGAASWARSAKKSRRRGAD